MNLSRLLSKISVSIMFYSALVVAELPPYVYEQYRKAAPEKIEIIIEELISTKDRTSYSSIITIKAKATVKKVFRTDSELSEGQKIKIQYEIKEHDEPIVGPSQPIYIKTGKSYVDYLSIQDDYYVISAGGQSIISSERHKKYFSNE